MSNPESDPVSSIRAVRPVIASKSLREFIRSAEKLFVDEGLDIARQPGIEPLVFAANGLHSTLYARRAPANETNNERLERVENYIRSPWHEYPRNKARWSGGPKELVTERRRNPLLEELERAENMWVPDTQQLFLRASKIVCSTVAEVEGGVTELALRVDDGPVASLLLAQSELIHEAAKRPIAASALPRANKVDNPLELPFMRAVFTDPEVLDEFIESLESELPVFEVGLRPISFRHELVG
ncbi:MAG: hypothetical protein ACREGB_05720 [Candidatus Saccharimonadales bacterium]